MKSPRLTKAYWISTSLFVLWLAVDGAAGILEAYAGKIAILQLGYPPYLLSILGASKILAAIAIVQPKYRTVKEWAFAGYAITCVGASLSWAFVNAPMLNIILPIVFLALAAIPYALWKKLYGKAV